MNLRPEEISSVIKDQIKSIGTTIIDIKLQDGTINAKVLEKR